MSANSLATAMQRWYREAEFGVCPTRHYRCPYADWGDGPAILFIHGLSDRARSFVPLMAELADSFRCIAYDLPTGMADKAPVGAYRHEYFVDDLVDLLEHFQLDQAYLFGSSFGSTITLRALYQEPKRFPRAILQGGFAHRPLVRIERALASFARYFPGTLGQLPLAEQASDFIDRSTFDGCSPELWSFFRANSRSSRSRAIALRSWILDRLDLRPMLPQIHQPVLMIGGEGDRIIFPFMEEIVRSNLPNAKRVELAKCGHYPQYLQPLQVANLMREFLIEGAA